MKWYINEAGVRFREFENEGYHIRQSIVCREVGAYFKRFSQAGLFSLIRYVISIK